MSEEENSRIDETTARIPNRYLTTIEEVDEDEFEDVDMDEKGLLSHQYRSPPRSFRRRLYLQLLLCTAIGIFVLHTVLSHKDTPSPDLVHLPPSFAPSAVPDSPTPSTQPSSSVPSLSSNLATSSPPPPPTSSPSAAALQQALTLLPSGDEYASLLLPPPSTSPRDLFSHLESQFRAFTPLLPAYEALHASPVPHAPLHPRYDIASTISSSSPKRDPESLGEELRGYETFLYLFGHLAGEVAPWVSSAKAGEDIVAMHRRLEEGGRGVVMTTSSEHVERRVGMINRLREEGCKLPIEVVYFSSETLSREGREKLEGLEGVVLRSVEGMVEGKEWVKEETLKGFALLLSRFREAVFLNTDVLPDKPGELFDGEEYAGKGALFLRAQGPRGPDGDRVRVDHNVVVVDKWRHFTALLASVRLAGSEWMRDENLLQELEVKKEFVGSEMWRLGFEMVSEEKLDFFTR